MVDWLDKGGIEIDEIRPADLRSSDGLSVARIVRGAAVVHALLVSPSTIVFDAVPLAGSLGSSVCTSVIAGITSYQVRMAGITVNLDYSRSLHFATHLDALLITTDDGTWNRLLKIGASPIQIGTC